MTDLGQIHETIKNSLLAAKKPLILSHIRPDGDAIGSMIGLSLALQTKGKKPRTILVDGLPRKFKFLVGADKITRKINGEHDLIIAVDCADKKRVGYAEALPKVDINIDHHITNEMFAQTNLVFPEQPATASILAKYLPKWGFEINKDIANALMLGMVTDTIGFRTSNVTPEFLRLTADLLESGANLSSIYHRTITIKSLTASKIWGSALARLEYNENLAWTVITLADREKAKYPSNDDADLTNYLSSLENIDISILFNEQKGGRVKVSWRSNNKYDVSKIAQAFNGGGHPPAAGADIKGTLETVMKQVLGETKKFIHN